MNDPELSGKYLGTISADFVKVCDTLKEACYQVRKQDYSPFPIVPICRQEQPIGQLLIGEGSLGNTWNYYLTYLDEFLDRGLIETEKRDDFIAAYKDPDTFCCLFVIDQDFTNFLFIPYPED